MASQSVRRRKVETERSARALNWLIREPDRAHQGSEPADCVQRVPTVCTNHSSIAEKPFGALEDARKLRLSCDGLPAISKGPLAVEHRPRNNVLEQDQQVPRDAH